MAEPDRRHAPYTANPHAHPDSPAGSGGAGHFNHRHAPGIHHHARPHVRLVIYPGERVERHLEIKNGKAVTVEVLVGHIYVLGGHGESYPIAAGPKRAKLDEASGHMAGPTHPGHYRLGVREHHTTKNWPSSTIPWGATLRKGADGEVEFSSDGTRWTKVTGPHGVTTEAQIRMWRNMLAQKGAHMDAAELRRLAIRRVRQAFLDEKGDLVVNVWLKNDFGVWSWRLHDLGSKHRNAYFIHTTPDNEAADAAGRAFFLGQSHGCIHVRPKDRNEMMERGYLKPGTRVDVKRYGAIGPPR